MIAAVVSDNREEHGVGALIVARPVAELESVQVEGHLVSDYVEEAGSGDVPSAAFQRGYRQSSGQISFERNEARLGRRGEISQGAMVRLNYRRPVSVGKGTTCVTKTPAPAERSSIELSSSASALLPTNETVMKIGSMPMNRAQEIRAATGW